MEGEGKVVSTSQHPQCRHTLSSSSLILKFCILRWSVCSSLAGEKTFNDWMNDWLNEWINRSFKLCLCLRACTSGYVFVCVCMFVWSVITLKIFIFQYRLFLFVCLFASSTIIIIIISQNHYVGNKKIFLFFFVIPRRFRLFVNFFFFQLCD